MPPIVKRPASPAPKGPPAGKPGKMHKVRDNETWESVAQQYRVPVLDLIEYNFATRDPAEINWYLREYVGCRLETRDGKNYRFSSAANPGVIYIPAKTLLMDELAITGDPGLTRPDPKQPLQGVVESLKFVFEREFPPKGTPPPKDVVEVNYIALKFKIAGEGEIKQKEGFLKTSVKNGQFKAGYEKKFDDFAVGFGVRFDDKSMSPLADAVKQGNLEAFKGAILKPFEAYIKQTFHFGPVNLSPKFGLEASKTPLVLRFGVDYQDEILWDGQKLRAKIGAEGGLNVGLSKKGWLWLMEKVGRPAVRSFINQLARLAGAAAEAIVAEGVLTAGVVLVTTALNTLAITALCAYAVRSAKAKADLRSYFHWYLSAYVAKAFVEPRPTGVAMGLDRQTVDQMIRLAEEDAVRDARAVLGKLGGQCNGLNERQVCEAFCELLLDLCGRKLDHAKLMLKNAVHDRAMRLVGL